MAGFSREVARRIFSEELKSSNYSFREGEDQNQYAPAYLLTPTGAKCNRVFVVGTLTEKDDIGGDTEYWRGRLVDPTGSILIYAGQYQPEAAQILANMEVPAFVAVVGKPNLYQTEDGNIIISLRAESIQRVDAATRNQWIMDTARRTVERLEALKSVGPVVVSGDFSTADQVPAATSVPDAQRASEHYHTDAEHYRQMVHRALTSLRSELAGGKAEPELEPETKAEPAANESQKPTAEKSKPKSWKDWTEQEEESEDVEEVAIFRKPADGSEKARRNNPQG
jgi:RPA family protein